MLEPGPADVRLEKRAQNLAELKKTNSKHAMRSRYVYYFKATLLNCEKIPC